MKGFTAKRSGLLPGFVVICVAAIFSLTLLGCSTNNSDDSDDDAPPVQNYLKITGVSGSLNFLVVCTKDTTQSEIETEFEDENFSHILAGRMQPDPTSIPLADPRNNAAWGAAGDFDVVIILQGNTWKVKRNVTFTAGGTVTLAYSDFVSF